MLPAAGKRVSERRRTLDGSKIANASKTTARIGFVLPALEGFANDQHTPPATNELNTLRVIVSRILNHSFRSSRRIYSADAVVIKEAGWTPALIGGPIADSSPVAVLIVNPEMLSDCEFAT